LETSKKVTKMNLETIDTIEYLRSKHIPYHTEGLNCKEGWVNIRCPFCSDDSNHLGINLTSNGISCWICGAKGTLTKVVMKLERKSFNDAISILENFQHPHSSSIYAIQGFGGVCILPNGMKNYSKIPNMLIDFIKTRQISLGNLLRHSNGWTGPYNEKPCRIVFPITYNREIVSYVMRDYSNLAEKKYINADDNVSKIPTKQLLYGYDEAPNNSTLVLVEGPIDKMKLGKHALATLGMQVTKEQLQKIYTKKPKKIFWLFDSESKAQKKAVSLASQCWFAPSEVIELVGKKDPGELTESEGQQLMQQLL
jgi:DNA primase